MFSGEAPLAFRVSCSGFRVSCSGFRVSYFGFWVRVLVSGIQRETTDYEPFERQQVTSPRYLPTRLRMLWWFRLLAFGFSVYKLTRVLNLTRVPRQAAPLANARKH